MVSEQRTIKYTSVTDISLSSVTDISMYPLYYKHVRGDKKNRTCIPEDRHLSQGDAHLHHPHRHPMTNHNHHRNLTLQNLQHRIFQLFRNSPEYSTRNKKRELLRGTRFIKS